MPQEPSRASLNLGQVARQLYVERRARDKLIPGKILHEGGWDLLLDLYACTSKGERVCVTSACAAACVPASTAIRLITKLERAGFVRREIETADRRIRYLFLTEQAQEMMSSFLEMVAAGRSKWG
jgi:DNA-binding MarR family transcriptional regulator